MKPLFLAVGLLLIAALTIIFSSLDGLRRFLGSTRSIADTSDLDRYRGLVRRQMVLTFTFQCLLAVANLLFVYGLVVGRLDVGHVVAVLVFDGVLFTLARTGRRLRNEAKALSVREPRCKDGYCRLTAEWETRMLPEWR